MQVPEFDAIRTTEEINFNQSYKQYVGVLTTTAQRVDKSRVLRATRPRRSPRNVYLHDIDEQEDVFLDAEEILSDYEDSNKYSSETNYDINTTVLEISKASTNPKAHLPPKAWYSLSNEGKRTWDNLSDRDKASLIENLTMPQKNTRSQSSPMAKAKSFSP